MSQIFSRFLPMIFSLCSLLFFHPLFPQEMAIPIEAWKESGEPFIKNYTPKEYGANFQNWGIAQDDRGIMYFANNDGLLEYDGVSWRKHSIGVSNFIRSIVAGPDGKIYAGFIADFGYFEPDSTGDLKFTSLAHLVDKKYGDYHDFWFTLTVQDTVYFMSEQLLFRWANHQLTIIKPQGRLSHAFVVDNALYFHQRKYGLTRLTGSSFHLVPSGESFDGKLEPTLMQPYDKRSFLIGTYYSGLYLYDSATPKPFAALADAFLKRNCIYTGAALPYGLIAIGTQFGGLAIIDRQGNLYKVIDKTSGLQDNSVWYVYPDKQGGIWLALNKGISRVEFPAPLSRFSNYSGLDGNITTVQRHRGTVYVATSEGIRYLDYENYDKNDASLSPASSRDGWYKGRRPVLKPVGGLNLFGLCFLSSGTDLFTGTTSGIFLIKGDKLEKIPENFTGSWHTVFALRQSRTDPNRIYVASRIGMGLLKRSQGKWHSRGWVKDLSNKILDIVEDKNGALWVLSVQPGITRVENISQTPVDVWKFPATITRYDTTHGLPNEPLTPLIIQNRLIFQSSQATWLFDKKNQTFYADTTIPWAKVQDAVPRLHGQTDDSGQLWVSIKDQRGREFAAFGTPDANNSFQWNLRPFWRIHDVITINSIYPESATDGGGSVAWIASENVFRYDPRIPKRYDIDYPALIRRITVGNDSLIFNGHGDISYPVLAHDENTIHFEYAATSFDAESENQFRTMLKGFDKTWSAWSKETRRNYTNLPKGDYRFLIQAKNIYGHLSDEARFDFTVLPPWYKSSWMYVLYALLGGTLVFGLVKYRVRQLERKSQELEKIVAERTSQVVEQRNQLKAQSEKLQEMDRLKSRFFANISHEFRTPLTLILGLIRKFKETPETPPVPQDYDIMQRNAARLLQLINQLLDLAKLEAGGVKLQAVNEDIVRFLRRISASFISMAEQKQIQMIFNGAPFSQEGGHPAIFVFFDRDKLEKVFYNLLSNAFKFTPIGGHVGVDISVGNNSENTGNNIIAIKVSNSGPGVPPEKLPYIFDRFYQADGDSTQQFEGTGIGLALVKELVELHYGEVSVQSIPGERTTFAVQLPMGRAHLRDDEIVEDTVERETASPELEEAAILPDARLSSKHLAQPEADIDKTLVLVVEDHPDLRTFIGGHLASEYRVEMAENGAVGLQKAEELLPDLVISDIMMPEMDGYQLCKALKNNEKTNHIPTILLTAKAAREDKMEGLETGADDYLVKPFDAEELKVRVRNLIKIRQQMREKFSAEMLLKPSEVSVPSSQKVFLERLTAIIEEHIDDENFSVEMLGAEIGMSRSQLHRKLRAITNQSVSEFIRYFRLQRAADLIKQDAGNIAEIAYMVGFNSQAYFTHCFQGVFGCSPSEYKKRNR